MTAVHAPGTFVWHDVLCTDLDGAAAFYADVLGWRLEEREVGGFPYRAVHVGTRPVGGMLEAPPGPAHWVAYVQVEDVEACVGRATGRGASVRVPSTEIPGGVGRFAILADPEGATFAAIRLAGDAPSGDAGARRCPGHLGWCELHSGDPDAASAFYADVLGWETRPSDLPGGTRYHVASAGGRDVAGVMAKPRAHDAGWIPFVAVDDLDATNERAAAAGAVTVAGPGAHPHAGRFAVLVDPYGAVFGIVAA